MYHVIDGDSAVNLQSDYLGIFFLYSNGSRLTNLGRLNPMKGYIEKKHKIRPTLDVWKLKLLDYMDWV